MKERAAFLSGYLLGAMTEKRDLARDLAADDEAGRSIETWRGYLKRWARLDAEITDELIPPLASALGLSADAFPETLRDPVSVRLEELEGVVSRQGEATTKHLAALMAAIEQLQDRLDAPGSAAKPVRGRAT